MAFKKKRKYIRRRYEVPSYCLVCQRGEPVSWKNTLLLAQFITDRGKIIGRARSGVCAKHQRQLALHIKRARIAALLAFVKR
ncbi:MAG: 30S ribosomal protein S18 [bacterium]